MECLNHQRRSYKGRLGQPAATIRPSSFFQNPSPSVTTTMAQARRYCFTVFEGMDWLIANYKYLPENVTFIIFQKEKCPDTERVHLQCYAELKSPTKLSTFQNYFKPCGKFHVESANGNSEKNILYCSKESSRIEGPWRHGEPREQGRRTDLEGVAQAIMNGTSLREISESNPKEFVRNFKGLQALSLLHDKPVNRDAPTLFYLWGAPGCGKSRLARHMIERDYGDDCYYASEHSAGWFDGYQGEKVVFFDDFVGEFPLNQMLKLLDYGKLRLWVKGSQVNIKATVFIFTSNFPVEHQYLGNKHQDAWMSRFNGVRFEDVTVWDEELVKKAYKDIFKPAAPAVPDAPSALSGAALLMQRMKEREELIRKMEEQEHAEFLEEMRVKIKRSKKEAPMDEEPCEPTQVLSQEI